MGLVLFCATVEHQQDMINFAINGRMLWDVTAMRY